MFEQIILLVYNAGVVYTQICGNNTVFIQATPRLD